MRPEEFLQSLKFPPKFKTPAVSPAALVLLEAKLEASPCLV